MFSQLTISQKLGEYCLDPCVEWFNLSSCANHYFIGYFDD